MQGYKLIKPLRAAPVKNCIVFSHGLGDTNDGWHALFHHLAAQNPSVFANTAVYLPLASVQPVTLNGGYRMTSWFDIHSLGMTDASTSFTKQVNFSNAQFLHSLEEINSLVEKISAEHGISTDKIIVGGFSQGAALALGMGWYSKHPLAGIIALSGFPVIADPQYIKDNYAGNLAANSGLKVFQGHGSDDQIVALAAAKYAHAFHTQPAFLNNVHSSNYTFKVYNDLEHSTSDEELQDMVAFIKDLFK